MKINENGTPIFSSNDIIKEIYKGNLELISKAKVPFHNNKDYLSYVEFVAENNLTNWPVPESYYGESKTLKEYDNHMQNNWYIPEEYKNFDIQGYIQSLCVTVQEKHRVEEELELFRNHDMIPLLQFLKYLVDTMRDNYIVWGVGRGSSVASYCLYLIGIHKIDSIKYELNINEFLR